VAPRQYPYTGSTGPLLTVRAIDLNELSPKGGEIDLLGHLSEFSLQIAGALNLQIQALDISVTD
jgi:hypothetical protein